METYWHLETWDKEIIKVKPDPKTVKYIQELMNKGEGSIMTPTRSIAVKSIKDFRLSDEPYTDQKLLEEASQAFNEPVLNQSGNVESRFVKKSVPRRRWDNHYRFISAYRLLSQNEASIMIAFRLPVHQIDHARVQELSQSDEQYLAKA